MEIQAFGYLGLGSSNLDDWATFATSTIGMQSVDRARSMRAFRMDDRKQRLFIDRTIEPGAQILGWEVANAGALDLLATRLEDAEVADHTVDVVEPWPNPVDGAQVLDDMAAFVGRFVAHPSEHARVAHVLWVGHTHLMDCWESTPRASKVAAH